MEDPGTAGRTPQAEAMNDYRLTPQEEQVMTLLRVYRTVTAEQIGEAMGITWQEANRILLRLHFVYSLVDVDAKHPATQYHIV